MKQLLTALMMLFAAVAGAICLTSSALAQAAAGTQAGEQSSPLPSTWVFDQNGHLLAIPGHLETAYKNGQLQELTVYTPVKGGVRTTTYKLIGSVSGNLSILRSYTQTGDNPVTRETDIDEASTFAVEPYFNQVQADGRKLPISKEAALAADPGTILAGYKIIHRYSSSTPVFMGNTYRAHIIF